MAQHFGGPNTLIEEEVPPGTRPIRGTSALFPNLGNINPWVKKKPDFTKPFLPVEGLHVLRADVELYERTGRTWQSRINPLEEAQETDTAEPKWTGGNEICRQTLTNLFRDPRNVKQWTKPFAKEIGGDTTAKELIEERRGKPEDQPIGENSYPEASWVWQSATYHRYGQGLTLPSPTPSVNIASTPEILCAAYLKLRMNRNIIDRLLQPKKAKKNAGQAAPAETDGAAAPEGDTGTSASNWSFRVSLALSCIPVFDVSLQALVGSSFQGLNKEVTKRINESYLVHRILHMLTQPKREDLTDFNRVHMSWFLLSPWCPMFNTLRDLLARGESELKGDQVNVSKLNQTVDGDEDQEEGSSEQLLHRFMEVLLLLFSVLFETDDDLRSTPGRVKKDVVIGTKTCTILDDGYIYVGRGGTTPKNGIPTNRNRFGEIPILRYEAKRQSANPAKEKDTMSQIFAELLSSAILNMKYWEQTDPTALKAVVSGERRNKQTRKGVKPQAVPDRKKPKYHDAFLIHIKHFQITIHTARFPTDYLAWVSDKNADETLEGYFILHKVSEPFDLSEPDQRLRAAQAILILLAALKTGGTAKKTSGLFVARAVSGQTIKPATILDQSLKHGGGIAVEDEFDNVDDSEGEAVYEDLVKEMSKNQGLQN